MSVADELIGEGVVDSRGSFSVDVDKANEKIERFRLADPLGYVLELVQAARLAGATRVDVVIGARDLVMRCNGRAFSATDLKDLEAAILVTNPDDHPARQQLALGVSASRALDPRFVRVRSGGHALTLDDEGTRLEADGTELGADVVTEVAVQESFRLGHFVDFVRGAFGKQREEHLLHDRCRYARFDVVVNGVSVSGRPAPCDLAIDVVYEGGIREARVGEEARVIGSVGYVSGSDAPPRAILLRAGVVQEEVLLNDEEASKGLSIPGGFVVVVDVGDLKRDASFSRFVRNAQFNQVLQTACGLLTSTTLAALLIAAMAGEHQHQRDWAADRLRAMARLLGEALRTKKLEQHPLRAAPLFRDAGEAPRTLDDLFAAAKNGRLSVVLAPCDTHRLQPPRLVIVLDAEARQVLDAVGVGFDDVSGAIKVAEDRAAGERMWKARKAACELPRDSLFTSEVRFKADGSEGVVGFRLTGPDAMQVVVLSDHCHLTTLTVPCAVPGLTVVLDGPFAPNFSFDDVVRNAVFGSAVAAAAAAVPTLLADLDEAKTPRFRTALMACMALLVDADALVSAMLEGVGCKQQKGALATPLGLDHACCDARLLDTMEGRRVSLNELIAGDGPIGVVAPDCLRFDASLDPTLPAGDMLRRVLRAVVPHRPVVSLNEEALQASRRRTLKQRSADRLDLVGMPSVHLPRGGPAGVVGYSPGGPRGGMILFVHVDGRRCLRVVCPSPIAGLNAAVEAECRLNAKLEAIGPFDDLVFAAFTGLKTLIAELHRSDAAWPLALDVVNTFLPTQAHLLALQRLSANLPAEELGQAFTEVLRLESAVDAGDVGAAIELVLEDGGVPTVDRIAALTSAPKKALKAAAGGDDPDDLRLRLLKPVLARPSVAALLEHFGLGRLALHTLSGGTTTLEKALALPRIRFVTTRPGQSIKGFDDVLVLPALSEGQGAMGVLRRLSTAEFCDEAAGLAAALARQKFEHKVSIAAAVDARVARLASRQVEQPGITGEVVLVDEPASGKPEADLLLLHRGKPLARTPIGHLLGVQMSAVLDVEDITPTPTFDGVVHDAKFVAVVALVKQLRDEMLGELLDRLEAAAEVEASVGAHPPVATTEGMRARLLERLRVSYTDRKRALPKGEGFAAHVVDLPMFCTLRGEGRSLRSLEQEDDANVRFVDAPPADADFDGFDDVIVVSSASEREMLGRFFEIENASRAIAAQQQFKATLRSLRPLSFDLLDDCLVEHRAKFGKKAELRIGLPRTRDPRNAPGGLRVGDRGLQVDVLHSVSPLPFVGVLSGESAVTGDMRQHRVDDKMSESIARETATLWLLAAARYESDDTSDDDRMQLREWLRIVGWDLAREGRPALAKWLVSLRARLLDLRVLRVDGGAFISIRQAIADQPPELLSVLRGHGLYRPPPPPKPKPVAPETTATNPTNPAKTPATTTAPTPPPPPRATPRPTDEMRLHERLCATIVAVRDRGKGLAADLELSRVRVERGRGKHAAAIHKKQECVVVDIAHPVAAASLTDDAALVLLTSLVMTRINERLVSVADDDEVLFHQKLVIHALGLDPPT